MCSSQFGPFTVHGDIYAHLPKQAQHGGDVIKMRNVINRERFRSKQGRT